jgi:hypothetical protein
MDEEEYGDGGYGDYEFEYADAHREAMPNILEMIGMCRKLGIEKDDFRTVNTEDAWAYYRELKYMLQEQEEKRQIKKQTS